MNPTMQIEPHRRDPSPLRFNATSARAAKGLPDFDGAFGDGDVLALGDAGFLHEGSDEWGWLELWMQLAGFILELLAPAEVALKDVVKLGAGGNLDGLAI